MIMSTHCVVTLPAAAVVSDAICAAVLSAAGASMVSLVLTLSLTLTSVVVRDTRIPYY